MSDAGTNRNNSAEIWKTIENLANEKTLNSAYLSNLLAEQCRRKEQLVAQKRELKDVTLAGIQEQILTYRENVEGLLAQFTTLKTQINKFMKEKLPSKVENAEVYEKINKISQLEKAAAYLKVCDFVKTTSEQMEANLETDLVSEAIDLLSYLQSLQISHLNHSDCNNLKTYYSSTVVHWEGQLKLKLTKDFEELLSAFGWPMSVKLSTPTLETHEKFHRTIRNLIRLSRDSSSSDDNNHSPRNRPLAETNFTDGVIPIQIMVTPLKKRFGYHFFSPKATGDASRPEWYFAQVKTWLRDLVPFIRTHLEPLSVTEVHISSIVDFVRSMSKMIMLKADSQLKGGIDDSIFSKILEESISYENEIVEFLGTDVINKDVYLPPIVSTLFSQPQIFQRWLAIERMACMEKLDEMFKSPSAWNRPVIPGPAEIVDLFIAVGRFVINRFAHLQQPSQKIQFLQLLIELLDHFRIRCLQIWQTRSIPSEKSSLEDRIDYTIADTIGYVQDTIESWEELPFFTSLALFMEDKRSNQIQAERSASKNNHNNFDDDDLEIDKIGAEIGSPNEGLFSKINELYECLGEEILKKWSRAILTDLRNEVRNGYGTIKWHIYEGSVNVLNAELMPIIRLLQTVKSAVYGGMDSAQAEKWLKRVLVEFDEMSMEELVQKNRFSPDAVKQISTDFDAIFTMLLGSSIDTSIIFRNMSCTIKVWNLPVGEAMLLYETLMDKSCSFDTQSTALAELELSLCTSDVVNLLKSRTDLP